MAPPCVTMLKTNSFQGGLRSGSKANGVFKGSEAIRVSDVRQPTQAAFAKFSCLTSARSDGMVNLETDRHGFKFTTSDLFGCNHKANSV